MDVVEAHVLLSLVTPPTTVLRGWLTSVHSIRGPRVSGGHLHHRLLRLARRARHISACLAPVLHGRPHRVATNSAMSKLTLGVVMSALALLVFTPRAAAAQDRGSEDPPESESKRIFGIIPNNRTSNLKERQALTTREKFSIAVNDSFDRGTFMLAAGFGGYGQLRESTPSFGHGITGYARYWGAAYADQVVANLMTEAVYPTILRQDPRYFRRGTGNGWSRLGYAAGQIFVTHSDSGATRFNFSEIVGNMTAVGISNAYYPDNRDIPNAAFKFGIQIGTDMTGNILKEFGPDLSGAFSRIFHRDGP
jgi:hypothetical protein